MQSLSPISFAEKFVSLTRMRLSPATDEPVPLNRGDRDTVQLACAGKLPLATGVPRDFEDSKSRAILFWNAAMAGLEAGVAGAPGVPLVAVLAAEAARSLISLEQEAALGRAELAVTLSETPPCQDPDLLARARELFAPVQSVARRPDLELHVLEDDRAQAFNLFNHVFVTSGELRSCPEDDRAITTLGHEAGHAESRDTVGVLGLEAYRNELEAGYKYLAGEGCFDTRAFQHYMQRHNAPDRLRRENELAADRRAMEIVRALGRDPEPALRFFKDKPPGPVHPPGNVRVATMLEHLNRLPGG